MAMEASRNKNDSTMFWEAGGCLGLGNGSVGGMVGLGEGNRRRKKRPSYGVRTVDITKGKNGFGFTISGQAPCMLSYIVPGSSAERSGLRFGDYLIAVNGRNLSKAPHGDVVRIIGMSKQLKLQIAENYYSDSSDDEFVTPNRQKPKYPNRLRHKQQQTRAERVVRDLQSGAIFSERAAMQQCEAALLSDRDWPEAFTTKALNHPYSPTSGMSPTAGLASPDPVNGQQSPPPPPPLQHVSSPSRRRFRPPVFGEPLPPRLPVTASITPTRQFEEMCEPPSLPQQQLIRARQSPVKADKMSKNKVQLLNMQHQFQQKHQQMQQQLLKQQQQQQQLHLQHQQHNHQHLRPTIPSHSYQQCHSHTHQQIVQPFLPKQQHNIQIQQQQQQHHQHSHHLVQLDNEQYQQNQHQQHQQQQQIQQQQQHLYDQQYHQQLMLRHHHQMQPTPSTAGGGGGMDDVRIITEQEISKILYPTLAELQQQQQPPPDLGESLYRAVVGYLGTIEVPKDSQGGSRLTAIKNCIRRLRIEKKVHTLVLMSVFTERVVLTNPHGITLAQYPAERITFCGVYADDKKFFGLVTVHGCSSDEFSDVSQDGRVTERGGGGEQSNISSSCHVFMVDPSMVQHGDHARRAKTFRIECTPAADDAPHTHCREFPESADPILHTIMSLYRSQPGFNFDNNGANNPGLPDDAQMSPQHSNTSSNSSNSDSGIGFRDEGGSHLYRHADRVFVVEVDDNQRMRIQNYHLVGNGRAASSSVGGVGANNNINNISNSANNSNTNTSTNANPRANSSTLDSLQANLDNLRTNIHFNVPGGSSGGTGSLGNSLLLGETSDSVNRSGNSNTNPRTNSAERNASNSSKGNHRAMNTGDRLRANKCDPNCAKAVHDSSLAMLPNDNLRVSVQDRACDVDSLLVNCTLEDEKEREQVMAMSYSHGGSNMTDYVKAGLSDSNSNRRRRSESRATGAGPSSEATFLDGRSSITDELRASLLLAGRGETRSSLAAAVDGRVSVTEGKRIALSGSRTPAVECSSPSDMERLTVRAMPDPVGLERAPVVCEIPPHVNSMRHSMHKYLQHKQQHLLKVSQKINRRESDTDGIHPLSVRAFSPANAMKKKSLAASTPSSATAAAAAATQNSLDLELSLKLSPKVYGLPVACLTTSISRPNAPSERSFSRSLEDLRDSSTSDGVVGSVGAQGGSFRDGSESDQGLERLRGQQCPLPSRLPLNRYLHASETNLSIYGINNHTSAHGNYAPPQDVAPRGAFRAVPPRAPPRPPTDLSCATRLTGLRPCGIVSIDQIINGVARVGATPTITSRATHSTTLAGLDSAGSGGIKTTAERLQHQQSPSVSPSHLISNTGCTNAVMGPPRTTTVLKALSDHHTSSSSKANLSSRALPDSRLHQHQFGGRGSVDMRYSAHSDILFDESDGVGGGRDTASAIVHGKPGSSSYLNLSNRRESVMSGVQHCTDGVFLDCGDGQDDVLQSGHPDDVQEYTLDSDLDDEGEDGGDKKWNRKYSLPRHHQRPRPSDRPASDTEGGGSGGSQAASPEGGGDRVQGWAASFERLLEDPAGLHTFAEFLRKEYSHENIFFWTACERYRQGISSSDPSSSGGGAAKKQPSSGGSSPRPWGQWLGRHAAAAAIYNTHLGANAPEPVNVDSQARQVAQEGLHEPSVDLFAAAQKQVFNLMKFDSYSRFLKSALYQECVERETRGEGLQFTGEDDLDPSLRIHDHSQQQTQRQLAETATAVNKNNFVKGKGELEERRRRSLLPWARHKDRSKSKDRLNTTSEVSKRGEASSISKAKGLSSSAGRLPRGSTDNGGAGAPARSNSSSRTSGRHPSDSSGSLGRASEVSGSRTSLNSGSDGILLMGGRKAISKESLTSSECLSLSGGEGGSGGVTGRCRVVLPDCSQSVVAVRSGVTVERVMRRLLDRGGLPFLAFNVLHAKSDKLVAGVEDSSALCGAEVRLQRLVLFRLDLPNQKTVCVKAKPHKVASDVLRPILAKYGFKLDLMHIHTIDDPRPINVKGPITDLDGQKFIIQTKEDVKEWGVAGSGPCCSGSPSDADALDAITNRVFEDLLHSKTSHQLLNSCDYDARSTKTDQGSEHSGGVRGLASRHTLLPHKSGGDGGRGALSSGVVAGGRVTSIAPCKDNDELYEGLKRAQMSRIEDQRGTKINSELPDFLKCDSENKENLVEVEGDEDLAKCFPEVASFLAGGGPVSSAASAHYYGGQPSSQQHTPAQQHPHHHHYHCQSASSHHHHHHLHTSQQQAPPLRPEEMSQQPYIPHSSGSAATTSSSITMQQHSSSSLAQHQAHNFWSDISGGGSSIPSSLLATSSSSLSSSTGLPMSSTSFGNFDAIDTPLAVASSLLDMHYSDTIIPKLRPRPESCVNTRSDGLSRPEQANRPKSSCGSLTAANSTHSSPDRTLLASPDLDETLSSTPQADRVQDRYNIRGVFSSGGTEDSHRHTRAPSPSSRPHHLHHVLHHRHHHVHLHQSAAALDSIASSSVGTNPSTSLSHTNINHTSSNVLNFSASTNHLNSVFGSRNCSSTNPLSFITRPMNTPSNTPNYTIGGGGSYFSTPPPPLPPKPKLGGPPRGPPPRPPSRQLPPALPSHPPPAGDANEAAKASAPTAEADAISFV